MSGDLVPFPGCVDPLVIAEQAAARAAAAAVRAADAAERLRRRVDELERLLARCTCGARPVP